MLSHLYSRLISWTLFSVFFSGAVISGKIIAEKQMDHKNSFQEEGISIIHPQFYRLFSFGNSQIVADWSFIKAIQNDTMTHVKKEQRAASFYDFDLVAQLDPAYFDTYFAGGNILAIVRDDAKSAKEILEKGEVFRDQELPKYSLDFKNYFWESQGIIPFTLGYLYLYELGDIEKGSQFLQKAAALEGAPQYVTDLARRLNTKRGRYEVGLRLLNSMISSRRTFLKDIQTDDPDQKDNMVRELIKRKESLELSFNLFEVNEKWESFTLKTQKNQSSFEKFMRESKIPSLDPRGGKYFLGEQGKIYSITKVEKTMGL